MIGLVFDIDGTLVDSYDLDERLYRRAVLSEVPAVKLRNSWREYRYSTDSGILTEILEEFNLPVDEYYDSVRRRFGELVKNHLQNNNHCESIPGAVSLLEDLSGIPGMKIGIATGGWGHTARMKLDAAGFSELNFPMSSSDDALSRTDIMEICASRMGFPIERFVYVGDAQWDLYAAEKLGWEFIGVGKRLQGRCDIWVPDLLNKEPFLALSGF
ncbi:MAG: HAD family phosphatase [Deltaproteobacteria bacterium]|nr:HAD family phosphatase [Deltaproteobacteria bacterium]